MDALELLKEDHQKVKKLFKEAEGAKDSSERERLFEEIYAELEVHAQIEETVFYPAVEKYDELKEMVSEALDEHQEVQAILGEMEELDAESEEFGSMLEELIGAVEQHVEEEEGEMFPKVREVMDEGALEQLGQQLESARGKEQRRQAI